MPDHPAFLKIHGNQIENQSGGAIHLRGVGLGGWMNMENFVTGFPANAAAFEKMVTKALGEEKAAFLFDRYLEYFFMEEDARFIHSLGLNLVRLPFNYRHFEDDMDPFVLKEAGFKHLDRVIELCAQNGLYTILDLHAAPGCQNQDWHSDNPSAQALFWQHRHFQDRVVWLWKIIAERYRDNPWVAGYNPLNEPADPSGQVIAPFYSRVMEAIRAVDPDHIIFLEGNRYAQDFSVLGPPLPGVVYSLHDYPAAGFIDGGPYPGYTCGEYFDRDSLLLRLKGQCAYPLEHQAPIWIGEFGPVYTGDPKKDDMRYRLLEDQISSYEQIGAHWALWTYKDVGLQGVANLLPDSAWMQRIRPVLEKKTLLGVDSWGGADTHTRNILEPIEQAFDEFFPNYHPFPFDARWQINRIVRHILLAEPVMDDFYPLLEGLSYDGIDQLMQSFLFQNCYLRNRLCEMIEQPK